MNIQRIVTGAYRANAYLVETGGGEAVLIDPGDEAGRLLAAVKAARCRLAAVFLTHGHLDHLAALPELLAAEPETPVHVAPEDAAWCFTERNDLPPYRTITEPPATLRPDLVDGARFAFGPVAFRVLATPGHSPGGVCLLAEGPEGEPPALFSGDTLFAGSIGRTDFEGSDERAMAASLRRLAALDPELRVLPGHGPATTIGRERATNPWMHLLGLA